MAPKRRGSANTKASPSIEETSNPETLQMNQLAKMIQGYEEKNNATNEMMIEMKKMFEEKNASTGDGKQYSERKSWEICILKN